jgi:hypothetical protein
MESFQANMTFPTAAEASSANRPADQVEMWRSKLGRDYPKQFMQEHEDQLWHALRSIRDGSPENRACADCDAHGTVWASVNLGVFLCLPCGSHHRSLGTHISLPKGCTGTYWWGPDELDHMRAMGNARAKYIYGDGRPPGLTNTDTRRWKEYLTDKYVHKKFAPRQSGSPTPMAGFASPAVSPRPSVVGSPRRIPYIDWMSLESHTSPTDAKKTVSPPTAANIVHPGTGDDFFALFGV